MAPITATRSRWGVLGPAAAPVVLLAAGIAHPYLAGRLPNEEAVAAAVVADPTRWGSAHLAHAVASAAVILAFLAVRSYLRDAGEERWSGPALVFVVLGSTFYAVLPGMEFAPLAAVEIGADASAAQAALEGWFVPVLVSGAVLFALGAFGFATAVTRVTVLGATVSRVVAGALVVMAIARFVPLAAVQFHVQTLASFVALWPLAYAMWREPAASPTGPRHRVASGM